MLPLKNNKRYLKKKQKNKCDCFNDAILVMAVELRLKTKNRSQR